MKQLIIKISNKYLIPLQIYSTKNILTMQLDQIIMNTYEIYIIEILIQVSNYSIRHVQYKQTWCQFYGSLKAPDKLVLFLHKTSKRAYLSVLFLELQSKQSWGKVAG